MTGRLDGKVAVVTGGASGIGRSTVKAFVREGARVVIGNVSSQLNRVAKEIGSAASAFPADVSKPGDIVTLLAHAASTFGGLHILCNNADLNGAQSKIEDYDDDEFDRVTKP